MDIKDLIIYRRTIPARKAIYSSFPESLNPKIVEFLRERGIDQLYCHQAQMYELAREGKEIERKARTITIFAINIVRFLPPDRFEIDVDCSKGTYIRTLCSDIGKALGCGAHMAELTRTRTGSFALEDAITLGELQTMADEGRQEEAFLSMEAALSDFPKIIVSPKSTKMLYNGGRVYAKFYEAEKELTAGDIAAVFDSEHHLVGLYEVRDEEGFYIKPFKMLI